MEKIKQQRKHTVANGEGSFFYSESQQKYIYQWTEGFDLAGKQIKKQIKQRKKETKKDFRKRVTELQNSQNNGTYIAKTRDTLYEILKNYIEQKHKDGVTSSRSNIRDEETLKQVEKCCSNFINKSVQKITSKDIENSKENMRKYSNSTIKKMWGLLKKGFKIAHSRRKISFNIMEDDSLTMPISSLETKKVKALTINEENKLENILLNQEKSHKYQKIILLQLYTGMRIGEVLALSKDCIDLKSNTITVYRTITRDKNDKVILGKHTKTFNKRTGEDKGKRTFPIQPKARKIVEEIYSEKLTNIHNLLFWNYQKDFFITDGEINSYLTRLNKKYKILNNENETLSSHRLRHTFVTRCQEKGVQLVALQSMVGHVEGSAITTNVYTDVFDEFMEKELQKIL